MWKQIIQKLAPEVLSPRSKTDKLLSSLEDPKPMYEAKGPG